VNRKNLLPADYRPSDLVRYKGIELRVQAKDAFVEMLAAMEAEGVYGLKLQSAYRAYTYQRAIFEEKVRTLTARGNNRITSETLAARSVQFPGASEHQLGLALDVSVNGQLTESFAETAAGQWVAENCHKYGFIIRYPYEKTNITNIIYEPWHLRYVGKPHTQVMKENNLTLEEYHDFLADTHMYVVWEDEFYFLIMYADSVPEAENIMVSATGPKEKSYIITLKKDYPLCFLTEPMSANLLKIIRSG
jgi:D-alanyl-D-alanine carboxypeptidase